ncbi:DUF3810 domain-containing protein [Flavobacterium rhizosphaerae]|uniref:DUF3810 domain-containing protein n=1 Tax=Flavobacterium rhizosphaerae TaxID=3163298 RepID=A0ABW8Z0X4_9FLAO
MSRTKALALLFPIQIVIINILGLFPGFIEKYYSNGIFPYISRFERIIFGWIGFSVGDVLYGAIILFAIRWLWIKRKTWKMQYKYNLLSVFAFLSVIYFLFNFLWALNYHRQPLHEKMHIEKEYTPEELISFTKLLITKANAAHYAITGNDTIAVKNPYTLQQVYEKSVTAYTELEKSFPSFAFSHESTKSSLISVPLSYMGFGGYLNPFTNEAQVNNTLPLYNLPTTTCHEMSHQIGYASESEANFIGYMASVKSNDKYFSYSGYTFALKYCLRNIEKIDEEKAKSLEPLINKGILKNFEQSEAYNKKYESFVEDIFKYIYDNYLKMNNQKDGLKAYSKFVGLLVNYYKDKDL